MSDRSVKVRLQADVAGYVAGIRKAGAATKDFSNQATKSAKDHQAEWNKVGNGMLIAGGVIAAGVGYATKSFMDFDKQMSGVRAVTGATASQMTQLSDAALKAGADTVFSASDAAKAEAELAKAGVSVNDILSGGLIGSMNLAAAGQIDLADSATIAAQAMNIFQLHGKDVSHIADVLTAGANKSAAGVDDLGQALRQGGLVASQTGLTFEETVGTLSAFADNALIGSDAGTSLKTMLQRLTPQSQQAADEMRKLGFSAYDAQGNFIGMTALAGEMRSSFKDLTPQARNAAMAVIFGSDAVRGANILYKEGAKGIQGYTDAVNDQGAAQRMASVQMDNLAGDVENLKGSLDTLFIKAGGAGNDFFRGLVQNATGVTNFFGNLPGPVQDTAFALSAVAAAALLSGGALIKGVAAYKSASAALNTVTGSAARTSAALKGVTAALGVVGVAFATVEVGKYIGESEVATTNTDKLAKSIGGLAREGNLSGEALKIFAGTGGWFQSPDKVESSAKALREFGDAANGALGDSLNMRLGRLTSYGTQTAAFSKQVTQLDDALATMVQNGHSKEAARTFDALMKAVPPELVGKVSAKFVNYADAMKTTKDQAAALKAAGLDPVAGGMKKIKDETPPATAVTDEFGNVLVDVDGKATSAHDAIDNLANSIRGLGGTALDASDAEISYERAIDAATEAAKHNAHTLDVTTKAGQDNRDKLNQLAKSNHAWTASLVESHASQEKVTASMKDGRRAFIAAAISMGATTTEAKHLADQSGYTRRDVNRVTDSMKELARQHPKPKVSVLTGQALKNAHEFQNVLDNLHGRNVSVNAQFHAAAIRSNNATRQQLYNSERRATGGPVVGPGTATSDSIPAMGPGGTRYALSNGEHIVSAAEVAAMGGHAGVAAWRKAALAGQVQYRAFGGPISASPAAAMSGDVNRYLDSYIAMAGPAFWKKMFAGMGGRHLSGSYRMLEAMVAAAVPGSIVTSDYRPGARTSYGNLSQHALGKAVDWAPTRALWDFLFPKRGQLFELLGPWGMYREGKPYYDPALQAMHENHIHASAYASGTNSARPGYALVGEQGPELVRFRGGEQVYDAAATRRYVTASGGAAGGPAPVFNVQVDAVVENPFTGEQVTAHVQRVAVQVSDQRIQRTMTRTGVAF